jgi:hypothetical protein
MTKSEVTFNPPPNWPKPPPGWVPPKGWNPDPNWPALPPGWKLWIDKTADSSAAEQKSDEAKLPAEVSHERVAVLEAENSALRARIRSFSGTSNLLSLSDEQALQATGIYRYHHPLENAVAYVDKLDRLVERILEMVKSGSAIQRSTNFTFDGSLAKGQSMSNDFSKLMLRAYNAEAENVVRSLRAGNIELAKKRLEASRAAIAKLGSIMEMKISEEFHRLRVLEIELTADYQVKKEEEREAAREERERLREERKVELELAAAREKLDKERSHLVTVIERLKLTGASDAVLEQKLLAVDNAIEQNDFRAANIRAGYVYVISNRGAFGQHVVKIGLTRRLEPMDRIHELGDASVPFRFDVHAIYFSEDAVSLENQLHSHFAKRRINWVNERREFFFASPAEVRDVLTSKVGNLLEFAEDVTSDEYSQSVSSWPAHIQTPRFET